MIKLKDLLLESKQSIINLGYPEIVAKIFYQKLGNKAFLLARWFKEYHSNIYENGKDWWRISFGGGTTNLNLDDYVKLYYATNNSEEYLKIRKHLDLSRDDDVSNYDEFFLKEQREFIKKEIEKMLFDNVFFAYYFSIVNDIISGKLKDTKPYEEMTFKDASMKYEEKRIFRDMSPLKTYENGFKWINVGKKCHLMGHFMKNCGSTGVMSGDPDRTMIGLFDSDNKPHVIVVYSPNEKRISGDEGVASTEVKVDYHNYIIDLAKFLGVNFDAEKSKSKFLKMKYMFQNIATRVAKITAGKTPSMWEEYFKIVIKNKIYYSDGYVLVSGDDIKKAAQLIKNGDIKVNRYQRNVIRYVFNHRGTDILRSFGVIFIPIHEIDKLK